MYTMKRYTVAMVRERLAEALDEADRGVPVVIERRGVRYTLAVDRAARRRRKAGRLFSVMDKAVAEGRWLILAGHEIGEGGFQTTRAATLAALCRHAKDPANGLWVDTVEAVSAHVLRQRGKDPLPRTPPPKPE